ncbi:MAG: XRE family transcriptional regulator [Carboxydocellales bacterium]
MAGNERSKLFYTVLGDNIKKYRIARNYSLEVLGEKVGVQKKTIQRYENGEIKIDMNRLSDIADALAVEMPRLLEGTESFLGINPDDMSLVKLPIVGKISCGNGMLAFEEIEGYEYTPTSWLNGGDYFYLRAQGNSMTNARIFDGDLVLIRRQAEVEDGEIAAVLINDDVYLKRVYVRDGTLILQSENADYPPIIADGKKGTVRIIGKLRKVVISF